MHQQVKWTLLDVRFFPKGAPWMTDPGQARIHHVVRREEPLVGSP